MQTTAHASITNLASRGDFQHWAGYATVGAGRSLAVRAEVEDSFVVVSIGDRLYECHRPADICVGDIRGIMLAAVVAHTRAA